MIYRLALLALVLFAVFYGTLRLCFTRGYLTRERLKKANKIVATTFISIILVVIVMGFFGNVDQL